MSEGAETGTSNQRMCIFLGAIYLLSLYLYVYLYLYLHLHLYISIISIFILISIFISVPYISVSMSSIKSECLHTLPNTCTGGHSSCRVVLHPYKELWEHLGISHPSIPGLRNGLTVSRGAWASSAHPRFVVGWWNEPGGDTLVDALSPSLWKNSGGPKRALSILTNC